MNYNGMMIVTMIDDGRILIYHILVSTFPKPMLITLFCDKRNAYYFFTLANSLRIAAMVVW